MATDIQFKVNAGASVMIGNKFFRGPCLLPLQASEHLSAKKAGRSGMTCLEDHIKNGFVSPVGNAGEFVNSDLVAPGVEGSNTPALVADTSTDPAASTPDSLLITTGEGGLSTSVTPAKDANAVSGGEEIIGSGHEEVVFESEPGSGWNLTGDQLSGKSIDELNVMIVERLPADEKPSFVPYTETEVAVAHLQQDA